MGTLSLCLSLVLVFLSHIACTDAQSDFPCSYCTGNSTDAFTRNLNKLFSIITSNTKNINGFYNLSVGQESDKVYGIALCKGTMSVTDCSSCLNDAATKLQRQCPTNNESVGYHYTNCMLRYSYRPIFGLRENTPNCTWGSPWLTPQPDVEKFKEKATPLFSELTKRAAAGDWSYKFATGEVNITSSIKVYALTQCTPDLSSSDCFTCLQGAISNLQVCCSSRRGGVICLPSCSVEFENYEFFNLANRSSTPPVSTPLTPLLAHTRSKPGTGIYIVVGIVFALLIIGSLFLCFSRRTRENRGNEIEDNDQIRCVDFTRFDFSTIQAATHNFSDAKCICKGSSASIFKGMLPGGQEIAVKMLLSKDRETKQKFNNEVLLLTNLQHRNLVKLLGSCVQEDLRLLVFEFLPNGSLELFLHDPAKRASLDWETRYDVIKGIARGLSYLHEDSQLRVIHRDLKPSNILLGLDMKPKISNFCKASHGHEDQSRGASSKIKGTYGYMPPELAQQGLFSVKSDVFSFGVLLLEIIFGQLISSFSAGENDEDLLSYAWSRWSEGRALDVVDPTLQRMECHTSQKLRCIKIALLCVQKNPTSRPPMASVVFMLNDNTAIKEPSKPAHVVLGDMDLLSTQALNRAIKHKDHIKH